MATKFYMSALAGRSGRKNGYYHYREFFIVRVETDDDRNRFFQFHEQYKVMDNGTWKEIPVNAKIPCGKKLMIYYDIIEITMLVEACYEYAYQRPCPKSPYIEEDNFRFIYPDLSWRKPCLEALIMTKDLFERMLLSSDGCLLDESNKEEDDRFIINAMKDYLKEQKRLRKIKNK